MEFRLKTTMNLALVGLLIVVSGCMHRSSPEAAAEEAFEIWAQETGRPYKDTQYSETANDGTFATVRITSTLRYSAESDWVEMYADVECRNVGGEWQADPWMHFKSTKMEDPYVLQIKNGKTDPISLPSWHEPFLDSGAIGLAIKDPFIPFANTREDRDEGVHEYGAGPVYDYDPTLSFMWGEDIKSERYYGQKNEFLALIDRAEERGSISPYTAEFWRVRLGELGRDGRNIKGGTEPISPYDITSDDVWNWIHRKNEEENYGELAKEWRREK